MSLRFSVAWISSWENAIDENARARRRSCFRHDHFDDGDSWLRSKSTKRIEADLEQLQSDHHRHDQDTSRENSRTADINRNERYAHLQKNNVALRGWKKIRDDHVQE